MTVNTCSGADLSTQPMVQARVRSPTSTEREIARPRLDVLLRGLIDQHRLVCVTATAGSGSELPHVGSQARRRLRLRQVSGVLDDVERRVRDLLGIGPAVEGHHDPVGSAQHHQGRHGDACRVPV